MFGAEYIAVEPASEEAVERLKEKRDARGMMELYDTSISVEAGASYTTTTTTTILDRGREVQRRPLAGTAVLGPNGVVDTIPGEHGLPPYLSLAVLSTATPPAPLLWPRTGQAKGRGCGSAS